MNETATPDFFDRLEYELRGAAERRPRRVVGAGGASVAVAVTLVALGLALVPILAVLGRGDEGVPTPSLERPRVGTVLERGDERHTVVATGVAPVAGRWQMEAYRSTRLADPDTGEEYQPAGLRCLGLFLPGNGGGGQCGEFPRTPGFSRITFSVPDSHGTVREVLLYGRVPEQAKAIVVRRAGKTWVEVGPIEGPPSARGDFYLVALPPDQVKGRVNWIDRRGREGSRGIELLPP
jgi:hypothetical protein